ncbi:MAG: trigger factor [Lachnospiraceae bacterium]|nr:trigger factor [Lachnospiraceae bacterium]
MSLKVEKLEHNMAILTIEAGADELEKAINNAYLKNRGKITVPGFRKGKAPRNLIEKMYGKEVFYDEASRELMNDAYLREINENKDIEVVSHPRGEVVQLEAGKPFIFTVEVALKPEVELGKYKGIKVTKIDTTVTDEEVDAEVDRERDKNSRINVVEGRAIQDKDIATIDFEGFIDGEAFDGGKGENHDLEIGSHSFIGDFEEQLIGKNKDEDVEVNVSFPEDYHEKSLAGKPALFKVHIKEIKEKVLPEADDEFASDVSEFSTLKEYKDSIRERLQKNKDADAKAKKEDELLKALIDDSNMDIPDAMVEAQAEQMVENYAMNLQSQGLSFEQYMKYTGMNYNTMIDQMKDNAKSNIQTRLVLEAVAKSENIEVTDEEIDQEIKDTAGRYRMEPDKLKDMMTDKDRETMVKDISIRKAADFLVDNAKETAAKKTSSKAKKADEPGVDADEEAEEKPKKKRAARKKAETEEE